MQKLIWTEHDVSKWEPSSCLLQVKLYNLIIRQTVPFQEGEIITPMGWYIKHPILLYI